MSKVKVKRKYRSDDDLHVLFFEDDNLEILLCDQCMQDGSEGDADGSMTFRRTTPEMDAWARARAMISEEGAQHMCQGHDHALCEHIYRRHPSLSIGAAS